MPISQKAWFSLVKILLFRFGATEKRSKIYFKTRSKKTSSENRLSGGFGVDFGSLWRSKATQNDLEKPTSKKALKIGPKWAPRTPYFRTTFVPRSKIHPPYSTFVHIPNSCFDPVALTRQTPTSGAADFHQFWGSKTGPKICTFSALFENAYFAKNTVFP